MDPLKVYSGLLSVPEGVVFLKHATALTKSEESLQVKYGDADVRQTSDH